MNWIGEEGIEEERERKRGAVQGAKPAAGIRQVHTTSHPWRALSAGAIALVGSTLEGLGLGVCLR